MSETKGPAEPDARNLVQGPIPAHLRRLAVPMAIGIVAVIFFNLVDTWYISRLGEEYLAAVSFTFPVVSFIVAVSVGLSIAVASVVSRMLGASQMDAARHQVTCALLFCALLVLVLSAVGYVTIDPLFAALGATEAQLGPIRDYMQIWYAGAVFLVIPMVGNSAIRSSGDTRTPALIMLSAGLVNAVIDPMFIFGFGPIPAMGVKGAAWATLISRSTTLVMALYLLAFRERLLAPMTAVSVHSFAASVRALMVVGVPSILTQIVTPLTTGLLTRIVAGFGPEAVAAYGAGTRIEMLLQIAPWSISSGIAPLIGQNRGAGNHGRVAQAMRTGLVWGMTISAVLWLVVLPLRHVVADGFTETQTAGAALALFLLLVPASHPGLTAYLLVNSSLNAMGLAARATFIAVVRAFPLTVGLSWLLSQRYGLIGVFVGMAAANLLTAVLSLALTRRHWRRQPVSSSHDPS